MTVPEPTTTLLSREIRQCALQAMYQMDAATAAHDHACVEMIHESLEGMPGGDRARAAGVRLAQLAWEMQPQADADVALVAEDWPTYRQPMIDRNLLRLCYYEMLSGRTPHKVAINEAVEIAKDFGTDKSSMFINGVLDKLLRARREQINAARSSWKATCDEAAEQVIASSETPVVEEDC